MPPNLSTYETILPSRYITFTVPHQICVAVLDSPLATSGGAASVAAMSVPEGRESDWIFCTFDGHLQLLHSSPCPGGSLSRLILVGSVPSHPHPTSYDSTLYRSTPKHFQEILGPLIVGLIPKSAYLDNGEAPGVPFLIYEDEVVRVSVLEICEGPRVGEMLIENVELLGRDGVTEFRRRLRFKRMPNFVQTQMKIRQKIGSSLEDLDNVEFELDKGVLVHPYLSPMVAGLSVISRFLDGQFRDGIRPKALCLGVGGGALVGFLNDQLNFEVVGVDEDPVVLDIAKRYFGLENNELIHLLVQDGFDYLQDLSVDIGQHDRFDVIMIDLDSSDDKTGPYAPPMELFRTAVIEATREVLHDEGVVVINVVPFCVPFYERLISQFQSLFEELYEIDVGNEENFVLIATKSKVEHALDANEEDGFLTKLKGLISSSCIDSIRRISNTTSVSRG